MVNPNFELFVKEAKSVASSQNVIWDIALGDDGFAMPGSGWNLTEMTGGSPPPCDRLRDFGTDRIVTAALSSLPFPGPQRTYVRKPLSAHWQDLIKACVIYQLFVQRNTTTHAANNIARPLRVLATCVARNEPWTMTVDDLAFAFDVARKVQPSGKLADLIVGVVKSILDPNHLVDSSPLYSSLERARLRSGARRAAIGKSHDELRSDLQDRKHAEKLPERRAFWELARIVFTERPRTFLDVLRFAQAQVLLLTGMRVGETALLPADWKRCREYFDPLGRAAGQSGGFSRSLQLRHFAEKQRLINQEGIALFETVQHIPPMFEEILTETLDRIATLTAPLRNTLKRQIETRRVFPFFKKEDLVRAIELYTYLTGNPFLTNISRDLRQRYCALYGRNYDPEVLDELRIDQLENMRYGKATLNQSAYNYLQLFKGAPFRRADGSLWSGTKRWDSIYLRVEEVEKYLSEQLPTKQSDTIPIALAVGELSIWELMFLMPKRALSDVKEGGLCDITRYCAVGRIDRQLMTRALATGREQTIFSVYSENDEDRSLTLNPHSLRHLQNTELFRLGVADTIITKRFNRRSVAQSYEYDHRTLAEELNQIELRPEHEIGLGDKASTVARMIKSGRAGGPIVEAFRQIQRNEGEDAAFQYLRVEADGFHSTPYGHCINSFTVDPCPKHLECFSGCRHLSVGTLPEHRRNLIQLQTRLESAVRSIEARQSNSIGRHNQLQHAQSRLAIVGKLLSAAPGQPLYPDGPDLSKGHLLSNGSVLDADI